MNVGMMWFDNDPKMVLTAKVARAASYYRDKYGKNPSLCFVHPSLFPLNVKASGAKKPGSNGEVNGNKSNGNVLKAGEVEIRSSQAVLPNHFWIGMNGKSNLFPPDPITR